MARLEHSVFVPNDGDRKETATLLVGTAEEYGISQQSIRTTPSGFFITEELAAIVYDENQSDGDNSDGEPTDPPPAEDAKGNKTSGNRAGKKNSEEE